jgi:hypothetical protein
MQHKHSIVREGLHTCHANADNSNRRSRHIDDVKKWDFPMLLCECLPSSVQASPGNINWFVLQEKKVVGIGSRIRAAGESYSRVGGVVPFKKLDLNKPPR